MHVRCATFMPGSDHMEESFGVFDDDPKFDVVVVQKRGKKDKGRYGACVYTHTWTDILGART